MRGTVSPFKINIINQLKFITMKFISNYQEKYIEATNKAELIRIIKDLEKEGFSLYKDIGEDYGGIDGDKDYEGNIYTVFMIKSDGAYIEGEMIDGINLPSSIIEKLKEFNIPEILSKLTPEEKIILEHAIEISNNAKEVSNEFIPFQSCPHCQGDGTVFVREWNGSASSISSGPQSCPVCNGARVIPMYRQPKN
jgi:hypothetical protein